MHTADIHELKISCYMVYSSILLKTGIEAVCISPVWLCSCWPLLGGVPSPHWSGLCRMLLSEVCLHSVREGGVRYQHAAKVLIFLLLYNLSRGY